MIGFVFRPMASGAVALRGIARRLANRLRGRGVKTEIHDGYLLRAQGTGKSVIVTAIDPPALWLFLHHQTPPGGNLERLMGVRCLDRDAIRGDGPATPWQPETDNVLLRWAPGAGYYGSLDTGALGILINEVTIPSVRPEQVEVVTRNVSGEMNVGDVAWDMRFQLFVQSLTPQVGTYRAGQSTSGRTILRRDLRDVLLPETKLRTLLGDSQAQMVLRGSFSGAGVIPAFAAQVARNVAVVVEGDSAPYYSDVVIAGAYVSQSQSQQYQPRAGLFFARLRRPASISATTYPLTAVSVVAQLATDNPEPELAPGTYVYPDTSEIAYHYHGVNAVGMAYQPPTTRVTDGVVTEDDPDKAMLLAAVFCTGEDGHEWVALQAIIATGIDEVDKLTLRKTTERVGWHMGPELRMFGVHGMLVIEGTVGASPELALWHVGVDGVMRETGLHGAGWKPLTHAHADVGMAVTNGNVWGQSSIYAADLGNGQVGVLARDTAVDASGTPTEWTLVVLNAETGAFVEARGALPSADRYYFYSLHLAVLEQQQATASGIRPAVLLATNLGKHYLSRDGGQIWTLAFTGYEGYPLYVGNQLHAVKVGEGL